MQSDADRRLPLVAIVGPTAVGKSEIAIHLAQRLNGEVVSADSRLIYRGMDIGTAKPTLAERDSVAHHLIDVANPDEDWSLARYQSAAHQVIQTIHARGNLPLLVGGTGQYVWAVLEAWQIPPGRPNSRMRRILNDWAISAGAASLHDRLAVLDPVAASRIDPRNIRRTVRALEVILSTGKRFSEQRLMGASPYRQLLLGLKWPRNELYRRIDERIQAMLAKGLVQEVQALLQKGYPPDLPAFSGIGYREIVEYLQGRHSLDEAVRLMRRRTRIFVRRQANWFRQDDPRIRWFQARPSSVDDMEEAIRAWLLAKNCSQNQPGGAPGPDIRIDGYGQ